MAEKRKQQPRPIGSPRMIYLTIYNITFALLWAALFIKTAQHVQDGPVLCFRATEFEARWLQTAALIEVLHAAFGVIKSPVSTTAIQVFTRVIQVWMVWFGFPDSTSTSYAYPALLLAWALADAIRYAYLALNLWGRAPGALVWLRYTMFFPLYPIGIAAEWWLLYLTIERGATISAAIPPFFYFLLALYAPGAYTMYTYMIKQRRKTLGGKGKSA